MTYSLEVSRAYKFAIVSRSILCLSIIPVVVVFVNLSPNDASQGGIEARVVPLLVTLTAVSFLSLRPNCSVFIQTRWWLTEV